MSGANDLYKRLGVVTYPSIQQQVIVVHHEADGFLQYLTERSSLAVPTGFESCACVAAIHSWRSVV